MGLAQVGPLTSLFEGFAAAVGAGIVLGGFLVGLYRVLRGGSRRELERHVLIDGYSGGLAGVFVVLLDLYLRYGL